MAQPGGGAKEMERVGDERRAPRQEEIDAVAERHGITPEALLAAWQVRNRTGEGFYVADDGGGGSGGSGGGGG